MRKLIIIPLLFGFLLNAQTTYYVDASALNDLGVGSLADPFKTITHGESHLSGGDTLKVRTGTYAENVVIAGCSGTSALPTIIMAYPGESPIIDGDGIAVSLLVNITSEYLHLIGFEIKNASGNNGIYGKGDGIEISDCIVHDCWGTGIGLYSKSVAVTYDNIIEDCTVYNTCLSNSDGIQQPGETWGVGLTIRGDGADELVTDCIVRRNTVYNSWGEGVSSRFADNILFEDNTIYDIFNTALYLRNCHNSIVRRNLVYMIANKGFDTDSITPRRPNGIAFGNEGTSTYTTANNSVFNNVVYGFNRNLYASYFTDCVFVNNTIGNGWYWAATPWNVFLKNSMGTSIYMNNIILEQNASISCIYFDTDHEAMTFGYNLYNKAHDADVNGTGDITDWPHFVDSAAYNFQLKASSPAINAGIAGYVSTDFLNALRDASPDIGAYEFDPPTYPPAVAPSVATGTVTPKTRTALVTANVISDGDGVISARGICYGASDDPDLTDSHTHVTGGEGSFSSNITGLIKNTVYHVRAYVTNEIGTSYGADVEFTTLNQTYLFHNGRPFFNADSILIVE